MESRMEFTPNDMLMVGVYVCLITITRRTRRVNGCVLFPTHVILHEKMIYGDIMRDARLWKWFRWYFHGISLFRWIYVLNLRSSLICSRFLFLNRVPIRVLIKTFFIIIILPPHNSQNAWNEGERVNEIRYTHTNRVHISRVIKYQTA